MPRDVPVADVMNTDVVAFAPDEPVLAAAERMIETDVDAGPVVDAAGKVVGMLSTTDLIVRESRMHIPTVISILGATIELPSQKRKFDEEVEKALGGTVGEVMGDAPRTIRPEDTVETAATLMHEHDVSRLAVVDERGTLVGIIARGDILRAIVEAGRESG
jgi:CBS domain-containing protein